MRVRGAIVDPVRDLGLYRPTISTLHVTETLKFGLFGREVSEIYQHLCFRVLPDMQKTHCLGLEQRLDT